MSERLFRFGLKELLTIRVVCNKCGAVSELPIDKLDAMMSDQCRGCGNQFFKLNHNPLSVLARIVREMNAVNEDTRFEFTLPMKDEK